IGVDQAEVILAFARNRIELEPLLAGPITMGRRDAILWVAYPKLTSALASDLSREVVRLAADGSGLETVAQIAIDQDWSAMRLKRS
ncbi:MAG: hypothetical protein JWM33_1621, partial [Caulobacteraceae bacterium]|nr:hypothetical protein [Caulobacteraceae bacterium]